MKTNAYPEPAPWHRSPLPNRVTGWHSVRDSVEFGRFRVLLRRRRLLADGVPVELGTRAFDLLLVLLEAGRRACHKGGASQPGMAERRRIGREPEGSDLSVAESTGRGPRSHPHGIRPRLPVHRYAALECHCHPPGRVGEPGVPPTAPAICNAIESSLPGSKRALMRSLRASPMTRSSWRRLFGERGGSRPALTRRRLSISCSQKG
jgi:hypothetical protein